MILTLLCGSAFSAHAKGGDHESIANSSAQEKQQKFGLSASEREFLRSHPVIRVGNEDDWPPFDFSEHGVPKGYAIDHLELLGRKLGISFEYVNGHSWGELLEMFRRGEIDLLPSLWYSKGRDEFMHFTEPFVTLPYVIITRRGDATISSFDSLSGKTVSVAQGYIQEEVLESSFPEIQLHKVSNPLEALKAITYGKADAYIGYRGVVDYLIATRFFTDLQIIGESRAPGLGPQGLHIAVRNDMKMLRDLLQRAMDSVSQQDKVALSQRWISVEQKPFPDLSRQERAYLRRHPVLRVDNLRDWPPFNFSHQGNARGFCVDYMKLLAQKLQVDLDFVSGPTWQEFMSMLETGDIDLLIDVVETPKRRSSIRFTEPYLTIYSGIVFKRGAKRLTSIRQLIGKRVAVPRDFYYQEILEEHYPGIEVVDKDGILECLKAVSTGKVDAALAEKPVFDHLIIKHFLTNLESVSIMDSVHLENTPVSIGTAKDRPILRNIVQKAMDAVTEREKAALYERWFDTEDGTATSSRVPLSPEEQEYLADSEEIRMCADPQRLPFEAIDDTGQHIGIVADIMTSVGKRIGVPLTLVPTATRKQSLEAVTRGDCDIIAAINTTDDTSGSILLSKPYFDSVSVMVSRDEESYIAKINSLSGKKVAVVEGNPIIQYLTQNIADIRLTIMAELEQCLAAVAAGEVDVAIDNLQTVSYAIHEQKLYNLKIAGQTPYRDFLHIGISSHASELQPILNKALASFSPQFMERITRDWLAIRFEHSFDTKLLWQIVGGVVFVISIIMYWNRSLARLNKALAKAHDDLEEKNVELERLAITDGLTGLYNRMKLEMILENECRRASRSSASMAIVMLDVDTFKAINDTYGHHAGDQVLRELAGILASHVRSIDTVGRWGGEEFLLICPETSISGAFVLAEKLRQAIEANTFSDIGACTCSFGVSVYQQGERHENVVMRADEAMYRAKVQGRNRVQTAFAK
ncbi:MAG: transporter substrate-binding domain-containing protein [Desulfopila sp.]